MFALVVDPNQKNLYCMNLGGIFFSDPILWISKELKLGKRRPFNGD